MMDDRNLEYRREMDALGYPVSPSTREDASYAPAILIAVLLLIGGYFLLTSGGENARTASNMPTAERSAPAPVPPSPATVPKQ